MGNDGGSRFAEESALMYSILFCSSGDETNVCCCFLEVRHPVAHHIIIYIYYYVILYSVVCIATGYGLDGPGIGSRVGRIRPKHVPS